ncbi:TetR/AcrR family transcriptional regulator [Rhizobium sp. KVB221]|uniref:TetR/AcrR family transcriptional regulator n=1 Tax=Rhizobium setariae TaxID=2801340 RepID=A0A936YP89_9HYPH|nr:TetR/AcrR family transcriptional regulator [Rhizobium setariae]MBL0372332.1 TetR/AcrR family transcriptional regulator [Rhizobium setariae]
MTSDTRMSGRQPAMPEGDRRGLILQAAENVFAREGFGAATMEEIARECGMAKKTLYRFFPDKLALFSALIESHDNPRFPWADKSEAVLRPEKDLRSLLVELAQFVLSPRQIRLTRLVISEAHKTPELARRFYEECLVKNRAIVAAQIAGNCNVPATIGVDSIAIADTFVGSTLGILQLKALMLDLDHDAIERELQDRVTATLAVFGVAASP